MTQKSLPYSRDPHGRFIFHEPIDEQALLDIGQDIVRQRFDRGHPLPSLKEIYEWLTIVCADLAQHAVRVLLLDTQQRVIGFELISKHSVDRYVLDPRLMLRSALIHSASAMVIVQVKPHGIVRIEDYDVSMVVHLQSVLTYLNIELVDYVLVAGVEVRSLLDQVH